MNEFLTFCKETCGSNTQLFEAIAHGYTVCFEADEQDQAVPVDFSEQTPEQLTAISVNAKKLADLKAQEAELDKKEEEVSGVIAATTQQQQNAGSNVNAG